MSPVGAASSTFWRRFAWSQVVWWTFNLPVIDGTYMLDRPLYETYSELYLINISIISLILGALAWWTSAKVADLDDPETEYGA